MRIDTYLGAAETAADAAREAEAAGFDGAFTGEVNADPFLPLAAAAGVTERLALGTSIAVAFARSPMTLAYTANDLQRLSRGRFVLGLGSQVKAHITRRFSMPWDRPAARMREFVLAMRATWSSWSTGEPLDFDGEFYRHTLMPPAFVPAPHDFGAPAVYLAGVGDGMTRVAGEVADGFLCHAFTTARWIREHTLPALADGRGRAGRTMDGFTVKGTLFLVTGTDAQMQAGADAVRTQLAFYASTPAYKPVLDLHGWGALGDELLPLSKAGRWAEMSARIDDEVLHEFAVIAPPDEVAATVAARYAGLLDRVSFIGTTPPPQVIDAVRAATG